VIESSKNDYTVRINEGRVIVFDENSGNHADLYPLFLGVSNLNANEGINGGWGSNLTYNSLGFGDANKDYQGIMTSDNYKDLLIFNEIGEIKLEANGDIHLGSNVIVSGNILS